MSVILERFEQDFAGFKTGKISGYEFFHMVSSNLFAPRGTALAFLNNVHAWAKERETEDPKFLGLATILLCQVALHENRIEDGLKLSAEAQQIFAGINDEEGIALSTNLAGSFYRTLGNIDLALKAIYTACSILKASGNYPFFYAASSFQLAELYAETGAYDRAIIMYQECIGVAYKMDFDAFKSLGLNGLAVSYHRIGKQDVAKETFIKAIGICADEAYVTQRSRALTDFGTFWLDEGDYDKAVDCHRQAMELRLKTNMLFAAITNMIQIGKAYKMQSKLNEALEIWQQALDSAIQINARPKISQVHLLLSEYYGENNDAEKALYHYKAFHKVDAEVNREDGEKKVKRAEILFAAEQTEKENAIIKAQKAEIERKNKELQETIDELTITKVSRRAKALTLLVAVAMILVEEPIVHTVQRYIGEENFYFSLGAKILIILSLKPIDSAIEHFLLRKIILKKKQAVAMQAG